MKVFLFLLALFTISTKANCGDDLQPLKTVPYVDVNRYMGKWYEISSIPQSFSKGCIGSTAFYELRDNGDVSVLNECWIGSFSGKKKQAKGKAWVVDKTTNSKLKVQFFWPFAGDYWIIELDENYEYVVVGAPGRDYLWVLSRTPTMAPELYQDLMNRLTNVHQYDISSLKMTPQPK